jgi:hypothetical protein
LSAQLTDLRRDLVKARRHSYHEATSQSIPGEQRCNAGQLAAAVGFASGDDSGRAFSRRLGILPSICRSQSAAVRGWCYGAGLIHAMIRSFSMSSLAIRQAAVVPLAAMLVPITIGVLVPGYSVVSQQMSELEMYASFANILSRVAAILTGLSIAVFGLALLPRGYRFTPVAAVLFGASMVSNGVVTMGSPWHGLYGIGLFDILVPAFFAAELREPGGSRTMSQLSMAVAIVCLLYSWMMLVRLDPAGFQGLTQRVFSIIVFGWYCFAGLTAGRAGEPAPAAVPAS